MRVLLLVNATASSVTARTRVLIQTMLADRYETELAFTKGRGHAAELASEAAQAGVDVVVVLGGDGTLNEVANGLARLGGGGVGSGGVGGGVGVGSGGVGGGSQCAVAVLPGGSTNVFARSIGTDDEPLAAAAAICTAIEAGRITRISLGEVTAADTRSAGTAVPNETARGTAGAATGAGASARGTAGRFFLLHCGVGFDAATVRKVERWPKLKRYLAHPLYVAAATATWASGLIGAGLAKLSEGGRTGGQPGGRPGNQPGGRLGERTGGSSSRRSRSMLVRLPGGRDRGEAASGAVSGEPAGTEVDSAYTVVLNTDPYTYLGSRPLSVAPAANLANGLSLVALRSTSAGSILAALRAALSSKGAAGRKSAGAPERNGSGADERADVRGTLSEVGEGVEEEAGPDVKGTRGERVSKKEKASGASRKGAGAEGSGGLGNLGEDVVYCADDLSELMVVAGDAECGAQIDYQIDGEYLGRAARLAFVHHPRALAVVMPAPPPNPPTPPTPPTQS